MESLLPDLFFLSYVAPIVLRAALAVLFVWDAKQLWDTRRRKYFAVAMGLLGILIGIGLFTQAAVIAAGVMAILAYMRHKEHSLFAQAPTLFLTLAVLLFLVVTGPGGFAFDLPY